MGIGTGGGGGLRKVGGRGAPSRAASRVSATPAGLPLAPASALTLTKGGGGKLAYVSSSKFSTLKHST